VTRGGTRGQSQLGAGATDQGLVSGGNPVSGPEIVTPLLTIERQFKNGIIKILNGIIKFVNVLNMAYLIKIEYVWYH